MLMLRSLDNRDIAVLCWMAVGLCWMLTVPDIRSALRAVVAATLNRWILVPILALAAYCAGLAALGSAGGFWHPDLSKDTVVWFLGVGLVLLSNSGQIPDCDRWFRREARRSARVTVFVAFFVNVAVFSLPVELLLVPLLSLLGVMSAFTAEKPEFQPARAFVDGLLAIAGVGLVLYVGMRVAADSASIVNSHTVERVALPVWLTLGALPFVYLVGLFAAYQAAFATIDGATPVGARRRALAKAVLAAACRLRAREVGQFRALEARALLETGSVRTMWESVGRFRCGLRDERQATLQLAQP